MLSHFLLYQNTSDPAWKPAIKERKREQAEKLEDFISYRWKSRCSFMRQVIFQANTGLQLAYHMHI